MAVSASTRKRQSEATRSRLLDAGIELFSTQSYTEVSVAAVARATGCAHGLLFHHFGTKREFYISVLRETARRRRSRFDRIDLGDPAANVSALLESHLSAVRSNPAVLRSLLRGEVGADQDAAGILDEDRLGAIRRLCSELGLDGEHGGVVLSLRAWTSAVDEAAVASIESGTEATMTQLVDLLLGLLHASVSGLVRLDPTLDLSVALTVLDRWRPGRQQE